MRRACRKKAAEWLVKKKVKLVGVDTACVDHPLATSLGPHRNGPQIKYLLPEYKEATGREAIKDFPEWNAAHKVLLAAGIPTIENVGGDLDKLSGKRCTFQGFPWKWHEGDACVIRLVAILDPKGNNRLESGELKKPAVKASNGARQGPALRSHPRLGPRHAAMAVARQPQRARGRVPRQGRPAGAAVRRHHASRHPHGRADPCAGEPADADRLSAVALLRHRRRGVDPEEEVGRHHAEGSGERRAEDPEERHRDDQHRQPPELRRQSGLLRLFARPLQRGGGMDRRARREARRHRRAGARSPARHVPRAARAGPGAAASRRRVFGRDRPPHHRRLPALGAGAQDHDDQRHPRHREHRRRHRQDHRQALHVLRVPVALAGRRGLRAARGGGDRSGADVPLRDGKVDHESISPNHCAIRCRCSTTRARSRSSPARRARSGAAAPSRSARSAASSCSPPAAKASSTRSPPR